MMAPSKEICPDCTLLMARCDRLARAYDSRLIDIGEYADNWTLTAVQACDVCIHRVVACLPSHVLTGFYSYLQSLLEPADFMPSPNVFLAGVPSEEEIREMKLRLRPRYIQLYQLLKERTRNERGEGFTSR
jgi:hypothetical protein